MSDKERRIVAYHESGHALCRRLAGLDPPEILSIVPRGPALGFVAHAPSEDSYLRSRKELLDEMVALLGGRAAEEEVFDESYSGAADDLRRVHAICVQMVTEFGMSVTERPLEGSARAVLTRQSLESSPSALPTSDYALSDQTRRDVDLNAQALANMAYSRARQLVANNRQCLDDLASSVLERETLTREELDEIFDAHDLTRRLIPEHTEARIPPGEPGAHPLSALEADL
jgi:cell division protease FtsH